MTQHTARRERVVILGGGMGAMATAWALTRDPDWRDRYEITVYQEGWLLGGKGASVRNRARHDRIEEHGLHIWMGFYENAFRVLREAYAELGRDPAAPLATWDRAFRKQTHITLTEDTPNGWRPWHFDGLEDDRAPGEGHELPTVTECIRRGVSMTLTLTSSWVREAVATGDPRRAALLAFVPTLGALRVASALPLPVLAERLRDLAGAMQRAVADDDDTLRRLWICLDLAVTCLAGAVREGLTAPDADFARLDDEEFRAWLRRHGAREVTIDSALVRGFYNLAFSHHDGAGAGTALLGVLRMCTAWRGAIYYEMEAGMGETVFAPLYLALKRRGVRFAFFHKVRGLSVSPDGHRVATITLGRQATTHLGRPYEPLIDVAGLPCWPESPLYEQLVEGDALRAHGHRFSSLHDAWPDAGTVTLREGRDFDRVVLGISHGALAPLCSELAAVNPRWRAMLDGVQTTGTVAMQLWMKRDLRGLGWKRPAPVLGSYAQPFDTWADLSHLLKREAWHPDDGVGHIAYLCGAMGPARDTHLAHAPAQERVRAMSAAWLRDHARWLFPGAADATTGGLAWDALYDADERTGEARLDAQYLRANTEGSERYVLFVAGSTRHRLPADDSGFDNLSLAGDWTRTGLDAGCVEAATMSGLQAARGILGTPLRIPGEAPFFRTRTFTSRAREVSLPRYIDRPDEMSVRAPYAMHGVSLDAWAMRGETPRVQSLVDRYLNAPTDDALQVRVMGPWVFLVVAFLDAVGSIDPVHRHRGVMSEVDVAVWVPVTWRRGAQRSRGWYLPWMFVDSGPAAASGREIFGFPKNVATMRADRDARGLSRLVVSCPVMPTLGVGSVGHTAAVLTAERIAHPSRPLALSSTQTPWSPPRMPMLFFKQFRDLEAPDRACYQGVVEADARATAVRSWRAGRDPWRIAWHQHASHPIAAELGVAPVSESVVALHADFDFVMEPGRILYERAASGRGVLARHVTDEIVAAPRVAEAV